jgi:hypothetical protein
MTLAEVAYSEGGVGSHMWAVLACCSTALALAPGPSVAVVGALVVVAVAPRLQHLGPLQAEALSPTA